MKNWSNYQTAVFDWVEDAVAEGVRAALIVKAVAGSGKTTTIVECANRLPENKDIVFLAFNKEIADELGQRLPDHVDSRTLHSMGMRICTSHFGRVQIDSSKLYKIVKKKLKDNPRYPLWKNQGVIQKLVGLAKSSVYVPSEDMNGKLLDDAAVVNLIEHHGIELSCPLSQMCEWVQEALRLASLDTSTLDFDDMVYFPVAYDIGAPKFNVVIIDEAQDVSHLDRALLHKILDDEGMLIAVGDDNQAIYGFRGADSSSLDNIIREFEADELPLSITYRCPQKVVTEAQRYVPEIEPAPSASEGIVETLGEFVLADFNKDDLVLCRNTAPIIEMAYKMIRARIPCRVKGRDIGKGLTNLIKSLTKGRLGTHVDTFLPKLDEWKAKEIKKAKEKDDERKQESINDRYECIHVLITASQSKTMKPVCDLITKMFSGKTGTMFSTVHRAKGLEADVVYILQPELMPSKWAKKPWQRVQETNLLYVAVTRAKQALYFLPKESVQDDRAHQPQAATA